MACRDALRILDYMLEHDGITSLIAANRLCITSGFHSRLSDLKKEGVSCPGVVYVTRHGKRCLKYRATLVPKNVRKQLEAMKRAMAVCA